MAANNPQQWEIDLQLVVAALGALSTTVPVIAQDVMMLGQLIFGHQTLTDDQRAVLRSTYASALADAMKALPPPTTAPVTSTS